MPAGVASWAAVPTLVLAAPRSRSTALSRTRWHRGMRQLPLVVPQSQPALRPLRLHPCHRCYPPLELWGCAWPF